MEIVKVTEDKKRFLPLLLLADEQESMIDRYLARGELYAMYEGGVVAVSVVTDEGNGVLEIKNLAVAPAQQRRGYGRAMVDFLRNTHRGSFRVLRVGTGESPLTMPFYERCGFRRCGVVKDFFTENYDHPIIEGGVLLRDMALFEMEL